MEDVKKGWLDLWFWKLSTLLTLWIRALKNQTISVTKVRNIVTKMGELSCSDLFPP